MALEEWKNTVDELQNKRPSHLRNRDNRWAKACDLVMANKGKIERGISRTRLPYTYKKALVQGLNLTARTLDIAGQIGSNYRRMNPWIQLAMVALDFCHDWLPSVMVNIKEDILPAVSKYTAKILNEVAKALKDIATVVLGIFEKLRQFAKQVIENIWVFLKSIISSLEALVAVSCIAAGALIGAALGGPLGAAAGSLTGLVVGAALTSTTPQK